VAETLPPTATPVAEPGERGTLVIRERVVERIAERAALGVDGVVRRPSTLGRVTGRDLPRAEATVAGDRTRVRVEIAVAWPAPLAATAATVRDRVHDLVASCTGCTVDAVDVRASSLAPTPDPTPQRSLT
jgi:uncharacterized alkaline shock family protein YloU